MATGKNPDAPERLESQCRKESDSKLPAPDLRPYVFIRSGSESFQSRPHRRHRRTSSAPRTSTGTPSTSATGNRPAGQCDHVGTSTTNERRRDEHTGCFYVPPRARMCVCQMLLLLCAVRFPARVVRLSFCSYTTPNFFPLHARARVAPLSFCSPFTFPRALSRCLFVARFPREPFNSTRRIRRRDERTRQRNPAPPATWEQANDSKTLSVHSFIFGRSLKFPSLIPPLNYIHVYPL